MSAEHELIHEDVRLIPEHVWDRLAAFLCTSAAGASRDDEQLSRVDLIEDLMFWHADAFIDRLERLVETCPQIRMDVALAHVGGVAVGPGLERFYALQDVLSDELEAAGELLTCRGTAPLDAPTEPPN